MKRFFKQLTKRNFKFAIQKKEHGNTVSLIPVMKEPGMLSQWRPIVKVYDKYLVMDYEKPGGLSEKECMAHIRGYKKQVEKELEDAHMVTKVEEIEILEDAVIL